MTASVMKNASAIGNGNGNGNANKSVRPFNVLGFRKRSNLTLFLLLGIPFLLFSLLSIKTLDYAFFCDPENMGTVSGAISGECFVFDKTDYHRLGIQLHLRAIVPASILAFFQFVPLIRARFMVLHRINGYVITLLSIAATVGALMIGNVSVGGTAETAVGTVVLGGLFVGSLGISIYNIQKLQIDQHRVWALRAWCYGSCIVTARPVIAAGMLLLLTGTTGPHAEALRCDKVASLLNSQEELAAQYPACVGSPETYVAVSTHGWAPENDAAAATAVFGTCLMFSLLAHIFATEIYIHLTPAESERLRNLSYKLQKDAGYKNPGSAGLTFDRWSDAAEWVPAVLKAKLK